MTHAWFDLFGKLALVTGTGANGGNRHAIAVSLAKHGADLLASDVDVAKAAVFLASDAAAFITGHMLPVDGGNLALNGGGDRVWPSDL